jgi:hypothetical protein
MENNITVKVTEDNIIDGVPSNSSCCAIALSIMDALTHMLELYNEDGFGGDYLRYNKYTNVDPDDCWLE